MSIRSRHRRPALPVVAIVTLLAGPWSISAQVPAPESLSLEEALETARRNNPGYLATRNDARVAEWDVRAAYGSLLPSLEASSGISWQGAGEQRFGSLTTEQLGFGDQPSFYFSSYSLGLSYTVNGATLAGPDQARASRDATMARIRSSEASLVRSVTQAYLEVLRSGEHLRLARQQRERARSNLRLAEGRREVGSGTQLDVGRARVEVGRARVEVLRAENGVHTARLALYRQIGASPPRADTVELTTEFGLSEPRWSEEELYRTALESNPELASLRASRRAADSRVTAARSAYFPSLSVQAGLSGFTREASNPGFFVEQARQQASQQVQQCRALNELVSRLDEPLPPQDCSVFELDDDQVEEIVDRNDTFPLDFTHQPPQASLSLSIPIFQGLGRQRELEAARVEREDLRYQIRDQELALRTDIASGLAAVRTAYRAARIEARNQEVADEQLRLAREQYRLGQISFVELVEAETVKGEADRERITALFAYHDALANLEAVVGTSLRNGMGGAP